MSTTLRTVVSAELIGKDLARLHYDCGHTAVTAWVASFPKRKHCRQCRKEQRRIDRQATRHLRRSC